MFTFFISIFNCNILLILVKLRKLYVTVLNTGQVFILN